LDRAVSRSGVPIRLTEERWLHIVENHDDLAGYYDTVLDAVEDPDIILPGYGGALIAVKELARRRHLAVVYRELSKNDGFVITAYITSKVRKRPAIWRRR
jgi:hypothetical protein